MDPTLRRAIVNQVLDLVKAQFTTFPGYHIEHTRIVNPHQLQIRVWKIDPATNSSVGAPRYFTVKVSENQ